MSSWEVRKDGKSYAGGPMSTVPTGEKLRSIRSAGYALYVDGKLIRSGEAKAINSANIKTS